MQRWTVLMALVGVFAVGCGAATTHTLRLATTPVRVLVRARPACRAAQLSAQGAPQGEDTGVHVDVRITNQGAKTCMLAGPFALELVRSDGTVLPVRQWETPSTFLMIAVYLKPHGANSAHLAYYWANWCGPNPGPVRLGITLSEDGGNLTSSFNRLPGHNYVPACLHRNAPSTLQILTPQFGSNAVGPQAPPAYLGPSTLPPLVVPNTPYSSGEPHPASGSASLTLKVNEAIRAAHVARLWGKFAISSVWTISDDLTVATGSFEVTGQPGLIIVPASGAPRYYSLGIDGGPGPAYIDGYRGHWLWIAQGFGYVLFNYANGRSSRSDAYADVVQ